MKKKNYIMLFIMFMICFYTIGVNAANTYGCQELFGQEFLTALRDYVFTPIKVIAPILLLVFTTLDFAKIVFSDNKDGLSKAGTRFLKSAIAVLIVFFAPNIIELILSFINSRNMDACLKSL